MAQSMSGVYPQAATAIREDGITQRAVNILQQLRTIERSANAIHQRVTPPVPAAPAPMGGPVDADPSHILFALEELQKVTNRLGDCVASIGNAL